MMMTTTTTTTANPGQRRRRRRQRSPPTESIGHGRYAAACARNTVRDEPKENTKPTAPPDDDDSITTTDMMNVYTPTSSSLSTQHSACMYVRTPHTRRRHKWERVRKVCACSDAFCANE